MHLQECIKGRGPQSGYYGGFVLDQGYGHLVQERCVIFLAINRRFLPVMRILGVANMRSRDVILDVEWSGSDHVLPTCQDRLVLFRARTVGPPPPCRIPSQSA